MLTPDSKYQLIIVGLGRVAIKHLKAFYNLREFFASLILVEPNKQQIERFCVQNQKYLPDTVLFFSDLAEALAKQPEAKRIVAITTPSNLHYEQAKLALENNCHCLIEKPVTLNLTEANDLLVLSQSKHLQVAIGHIYRYIPLVKELQTCLASGMIGKILMAKLELEWGHSQEYYDQAAWRGTYAKDGGVLMNQSIHALDLLFYLLDSKLAKGTAYLAQLNHTIEAEDYAACLLVDNRGRQINLNCTTSTLPNQHYASFKLIGESGDLTLSMHNKSFKVSIHNKNGQERFWRLAIFLLPLYWRNRGPHAWTSWTNPHQAIYADLISSIENDHACLANLESGISALQAVLTLYKAAQTESYANNEPLAESKSMQDFFKA